MKKREQNVYRYYIIFTTLLRLLQVRGYSTQVTNCTFEEFQVKYVDRNPIHDIFKEDLSIAAQKPNGDMVIVLFLAPGVKKAVSVQQIRLVAERLEQSHIAHCILIHEQMLSSSSKKEIYKLFQGKQLETFEEDELLFCVLSHELVPTFETLTHSERQVLCKSFKITQAQLPRMLLSDPVCRFLGLKRGDIVRITRTSETAGEYVCYRYVCSGGG